MRRRRSPARWLAPLALIACALAVLAVLRDSTVLSGHDGSPVARTQTATTTTAKVPAGRAKRKAYIIKAGDVLSNIADRYGVTVEDLEALNPGLDARALRVGRRIRLRR